MIYIAVLHFVKDKHLDTQWASPQALGCAEHVGRGGSGSGIGLAKLSEV